MIINLLMIFSIFMLLQINTILAISISDKCSECCEHYCFDLDHRKYESRRYGIKTLYPRMKDSELIKPFAGIDCKPVKIWSIFRHGTRYPTEQEIETKLQMLSDLRDQILTNYHGNSNNESTKKCRLCKLDLELFKNWDSTEIHDDDQMLSPEGWQEIAKIARQYQLMFPDLFDKIYTKKVYQFRYTTKTKTISTFKAFANALFGKTVVDRDIIVPEPTKPDMILLPYESCDAAVEKDYTGNGTELGKFVNSPIFQHMIRDMSLRFGFNDTLVSVETIIEIWRRCQYEQSWDAGSSDLWCTAFTPSNLKVMDYYDDLKYYHSKSYGSKLNQNLVCSTVTDMLEKLTKKNSPKVVAYFVHSTLIYLMYTALEFMPNDNELRADNYEQMQKRKFKSGEIIPFSANFAAVKYQCQGGTHKIMFLRNQKPIELSWCPDGVCSWIETKRRYQSLVKNCKKNFCHLPNAGRKSNCYSIILYFLVLLVSIFNNLFS